MKSLPFKTVSDQLSSAISWEDNVTPLFAIMFPTITPATGVVNLQNLLHTSIHFF
jgi:hypothetical protein